MSLRLLVRDHPQRAIAIRTDSHALIFRHSHSSTKVDDASHVSLKSTSPKCMVEFSNLSAIDLTPFRNLHVSGIHGTLGLININAEVYLCVISAAVTVAKVRPGETVQRIQSVEFCQLLGSKRDVPCSIVLTGPKSVSAKVIMIMNSIMAMGILQTMRSMMVKTTTTT